MERSTPVLSRVPAVIADLHASLGEGPCWDRRSGSLLWLDLTEEIVHRFDPTHSMSSIELQGVPVRAIAPRAAGGFVLALERSFAVLNRDGRVATVAELPELLPGERLNDGKCDQGGRFWAGTMEPEGRGRLYCFDPDDGVRSVLDGITTSNGLAWSADGRRMYYIDSGVRRVDVLDYDNDSGSVAERRTLFEIPDGWGVPDGMTIDAEDHLWVALWGGGAVCCLRPNGTISRVVQIPATKVTSCCFGGDGYTDLYVTTAAQNLPPETLAIEPHAGGLFRLRPGATGLPPAEFRG